MTLDACDVFVVVVDVPHAVARGADPTCSIAKRTRSGQQRGERLGAETFVGQHLQIGAALNGVAATAAVVARRERRYRSARHARYIFQGPPTHASTVAEVSDRFKLLDGSERQLAD